MQCNPAGQWMVKGTELCGLPPIMSSVHSECADLIIKLFSHHHRRKQTKIQKEQMTWSLYLLQETLHTNRTRKVCDMHMTEKKV